MVVTVEEAQNRLEELIALAAAGEDVIIMVNGIPAAKLVALPAL